MNARIEWVRTNCRLLSDIAAEFATSRPFNGLAIGTDIHLEPKTAALILTLVSGGARLVSTGNLASTQAETVSYLRGKGVSVIGDATTDRTQHVSHLRRVIGEKPDLLLDNGGDLFMLYLDDPYEGLLGGTEETTSGRLRLEPLAARLDVPVIVINDSPIKQFAENRHAVGQSVLESYLRITNRMTNGRRTVIFGYGPCGKGIAAAFRSAYALVSVVETDVVARLEAYLDGFDIPARDIALTSADIVITATGAEAVVSSADLPLLSDDVVLCNAGHFPAEIDVPELANSPQVAQINAVADGITALHLRDGRRIHVLGGGHMVNLAGPRPLGNSIQSMDLGFALQARGLEAIANGTIRGGNPVAPVPHFINIAVAEAFLNIYGAEG